MAGPRKIRNPAPCHPERETFRDGLCGVCYYDQNRMPINIERKEERAILAQLLSDAAMIKRMKDQAAAIIQENLPRYAELHLTAAEVAASFGDSKPMEWALQAKTNKEVGAVAEAADKAGGAGGIKVMIGIKMGGLPAPEDNPDVECAIIEPRE